MRTATLDDAGAVAVFAARTFEDAFAADNRAEDMAEFLATHLTRRQLESDLRDPEMTTLLLESPETTIGWAQIRRGPAPPCVSGAAPIELRRFYIDRPWHGRGAAGLLMSAVLDEVARMAGRTIWLSVWERNPRAIAFYRRYGFTTAGAAPFVLGSDIQNDHIMVKSSD